jgi:predicted outer membrane protein
VSKSKYPGVRSILVACVSLASLAACSKESGIEVAVPAGGALSPKAERAYQGNETVLIKDARVLKAVDERCDRKTAQATLATKASARADVRAFAADMLSDYSELRGRLSALGIRLGFTPLKEDTAEDYERDIIGSLDSLMAKGGAGFDRAFLELMITSHREDLAAIDERLATEPAHAELRTAITSDYRAVVKKQLDRAMALRDATPEVEAPAGVEAPPELK